MILNLILILILLVPSVKFQFIRNRLNLSYGPPAYKYCECGRKNSYISGNVRIIGGNETFPNEYPWMALIVAIDQPIPQLICGGSLISDRYILTAAHCLNEKYTQSQIKVILGEYNLCLADIRTVTFSITKLIQHPKYIASKRLLMDIMLVKLNMRVTFNAYIRPICLPEQAIKSINYSGRIGEILGWGIGDTANVSCVLRKTSLIIFKPEQCSYKSFHVFCAGDLEGNRDACKGDSGGPFQIVNRDNKYVLIGIVSSGIACGDVESPGLYTDVLYALPWINKIVTQDSMFCWR